MLSNRLICRLHHCPISVRKFGAKRFTLPAQMNQAPLPVIDEKDMQESFVRGSGPGGQKINKSMNNVLLVHIPTGISVQCQETRDLSSNRKIARKLLREKVDFAVNGETSKLGKRFERIRKKKRNSARRASKKYGPGEAAEEDQPSQDGDSDSDESDNEDEMKVEEAPK